MWSTVRSAYAWVLLSVIVLTMVPLALLLGLLTVSFDARRTLLRRFVATWVSLYAWLTPLYRFRVVGREHLPAGPFVLVANHESGLDVLCLLLLRTPARFLAESWLFRVPVAGPLFRACRHIPVRPGDRNSGQRALAAAEAALREGSPVAIFPEGKLSPDGLGPLKPGAFVLARRTAVPVVAVRIAGTGRAWRPGTMVVHGAHAITIEVQRPVPAGEVVAASEDELLGRVWSALGGRGAPVALER